MASSQLTPHDHTMTSIVESNPFDTSGNDNAVSTLKRPLSGYNIFFQLQRKCLLMNEPDRVRTLEEVKEFVEHQRVVRNMPQPKRPHRKTHGKLGFREMARSLAEKWKSLSPEQKQVYEDCAVAEKERYFVEKKQLTMNQNEMPSNSYDMIEPAVIPDDSSQDGCRMSSFPVPTQIVTVSPSFQTDEGFLDVTEGQVDEESYQGNIDLTDELYQSQREIMHNDALIRCQIEKLQRLEQQMKLFMLNQRRMRVTEMMRQKQMLAMLPKKKKEQQQQQFATMNVPSNSWSMIPTTSTSAVQPNAVRDNAMPLRKGCWPISTFANVGDFQAINHSFDDEVAASTDNAMGVYDYANKTFQGVANALSVDQSNEYNADDVMVPMTTLDTQLSTFSVENPPLLLSNFTGFSQPCDTGRSWEW